MTLTELIKKAVEGDGDPQAAGKVSDICRLRMGMNYKNILERVQRDHPTVTMADWDRLLYECELKGG